MSENRKDKGMCFKCKVMEAEAETRGQGMCAKVLLMCQVSVEWQVQKPSHGQNWANPRPARIHSCKSCK